jgi:hypothetical protein
MQQEKTKKTKKEPKKSKKKGENKWFLRVLAAVISFYQ